jgi:hypothetical protein
MAAVMATVALLYMGLSRNGKPEEHANKNASYLESAWEGL